MLFLEEFQYFPLKLHISNLLHPGRLSSIAFTMS